MANLRDHKTPPRTRVDLDVSSLLSPPEMKRSESFGSSITALPSTESFNSDCPKASMDKPSGSQPGVGHLYNTPPVSPNFEAPKHVDEVPSSEGSEDVRDPQLFAPADDVSSTASRDYPLFPPDSVDEVSKSTIDQHMKSAEYISLPYKPALEDYQLAAFVQSTVFDEIRKNPAGWYRREREFDQRYGRPPRVQKMHAAKKLAPAPSSHRKEKAVAIPRLHRAPRVSKRTPKARTRDTMKIDAHATETTSAPLPKPTSKPAKPEDVDFKSIPDYSPPLETLDVKGKTLKAEWKVGGHDMNIRGDPDAHFLHEEEIKLATTLRLRCPTYLTSKRRIFQARLANLKKGKEFRKTDAQQACRIDVNKASALWVAYNRVGWFDPKYYEQWLQV